MESHSNVIEQMVTSSTRCIKHTYLRFLKLTKQIMNFVTYKKFYEQERVAALTSILSENDIEFHVEVEKESLDSLYGDKHFEKQFFVKIKQTDFSKADSLLKQVSIKELETVDKDHYLYGFSDEELFDILSKPDEWNEFDVELSTKILNDRGKEINPGTIQLLKTQRLKDLAKHEESPRVTICAGYLFALIGGVIGAFIGWHLWTYKKVLPNGQRMYGYTKKDRTHGGVILIIGTILFIFYTFLRLSNDF
jgi:hypothetical protein